MDIKQLQYFIAIAEEQNITQAAKRLHLSQPPLSIQLKALEEELGTLLVERNPRSVTLTDAGRLLYEYAKNIVTLTNTAIQDIMELETGLKGTLRLGTISSSGTALLTRRMLQFQKENPKISFELHEGNTFEMLEMLKHNIIEAAIVRTPFPADNFICRYIEEEPMAAVGTTEFFSTISSPSISPLFLSGKPLIYYRRYETILNAVFEEYGISLTAYCINDDARTTLLWAKAGLGIGIVPLSACEMIPSDKLLVKIIAEPKLNTKLAAIHRKNCQLSKAAASFVQLFNQE